MSKSTSSKTKTSGRIERLRSVIFEAVQDCNLRCNYCYNIWKAPGGAPVRNLSTWRTVRMLGKIVRETGVEQIAFSGGEPLLRDDLVELAAYLKVKGVKATLLTNGALLDEDWVRTLTAVDVRLFQITLLGMDAEVHDAHCGEGAWAGAMRAIELVREGGGEASVSFVLTRKNLGQLEPVMRFVAEQGARFIMINRFNPGGAGLANRDALELSASELRQALTRADRLGSKLGIRAAFSVPIPPCLAPRLDFPNIRMTGCLGGTGQSYFTVDPRGNIRLCNHSPVILGNARKQHFMEVANSVMARRFLEEQPEMCRDCEDWDQCHGGCRAAAEQLCGSCFGADPWVERLVANP